MCKDSYHEFILFFLRLQKRVRTLRTYYITRRDLTVRMETERGLYAEIQRARFTSEKEREMHVHRARGG